jgi:hypothetical protein
MRCSAVINSPDSSARSQRRAEMTCGSAIHYGRLLAATMSIEARCSVNHDETRPLAQERRPPAIVCRTRD